MAECEDAAGERQREYCECWAILHGDGSGGSRNKGLIRRMDTIELHLASVKEDQGKFLKDQDDRNRVLRNLVVTVAGAMLAAGLLWFASMAWVGMQQQQAADGAAQNANQYVQLPGDGRLSRRTWFTVREVAQAEGASDAAVRAAIDGGLIKEAFKVGNEWRVRTDYRWRATAAEE